MRQRAGFTLVEVLVALGILSLLLLVIFGLLGSFSGEQRVQAAVAETQGKVRRAAEVLGQEVRAAAFGALSDDPYISRRDRISFLLLSGPAGLSVLPAENFASNEYLDIFSGEALELGVGDEVTLVNNAGAARTFAITATEELGGGAWRIYHAGCANGVSYTASTLLFATKRVGLKYDENKEQIDYYEDGETYDLVYGVQGFKIRYQYLKNGATEVTDPAGFNPTDGPPLRRFTDEAGNEYELRGVVLYVKTERKVGNRTARVTSEIPVPLVSADTIFVTQVESCQVE